MRMTSRTNARAAPAAAYAWTRLPVSRRRSSNTTVVDWCTVRTSAAGLQERDSPVWRAATVVPELGGTCLMRQPPVRRTLGGHRHTRQRSLGGCAGRGRPPALPVGTCGVEEET